MTLSMNHLLEYGGPVACNTTKLSYILMLMLLHSHLHNPSVAKIRGAQLQDNVLLYDFSNCGHSCAVCLVYTESCKTLQEEEQ